MIETGNAAAGATDELLNLREAGQFLRASRAKMYRLIKAGDLPPRRVGSTYVFYRRDLEAYLDRAVRPTTIVALRPTRARGE